ncbi:putative chitinase [Pseudomonas sp. SORGH_AS 211]|uniref:hypothetical protein n=1 Tax=Pseudomonas sp. SORGH_AS_0211 TaxID=3041796 RepID=UPI0028628D87|nr:hypothetical protein [Pseudomonas sp. SORGH_AS_0211]MDR6180573.1 putative chitinase [Pseudomonas sp. SORGH_AS_0211]
MTSNPTAPQPKVENWAYPFKAKGGQDVTDPWLYQQALAHAQGGTYLLGSNGLWHGGVHFDEGTSAFLDQSRIHCIADGEVVAYRIDDKVHRFVPGMDSTSEGKTYSTSFVLIRHRLEAPQLPNGNETPPSLVFFSLYMHLLDWASYQATSTLPRPPFWDNDRYRVQTQGGKLNVRQEPRGNAPVQAELDNGSRIRIAGDGDWCQIIEILDNGLTLRPGHTQPGLGYVARRYLKPEAAPKAQNIVVVLDQPFPIKAGALLGHPGLYEGRQQIHLETFSCDDVPAFIERSRAWAVRLPESDKTLLKIHAGASKLITHRPDIDGSHPPRISDPGVQVGVDLILSQGQLDALPAADKIMIAARNEGGVRTPEQRWWHLKGLLADGEGKPIEGWLCERDFITSRHSPWDFPDYELVKETTTYRAKLAYSLCANRQLTKVELSRFEVEIQQAQQSSLTTKISRILSPTTALRNSDLTKNLTNPWIFQKIGALVIQHEIEWAWSAEKWDSLDVLMFGGDNKNNHWKLQKEIIKNLSWWNAASAKIRGLDADKCWYFNPDSFFHHFIETKRELITLDMLQIINPRRDNAYYEKVLPYLNKYAKVFKVNTPIRIAHFLAQTGHESGFIVKSENAGYSARRMREMFGCKGGSKNYSKANDDCSFGRQRDRLWSEESKFVMNAEALLNFVYSSRMGNGDESSGDGYKYRGRGIIQLTGKDTYRRYTEIHNRANPDDFRDFVEQPDLITDSLQYGIESAFVYWDMANANKLADADNTVALSKAINGGLNGFKDRAKCLEKIKSHLYIQR